MKTLAGYLDEYIRHEISNNLSGNPTHVEVLQAYNKIMDSLADIIKEGIEAYESTEYCTINTVGTEKLND
jgi:hypothetical protein